jgi:hypothetical protein
MTEKKKKTVAKKAPARKRTTKTTAKKTVKDNAKPYVSPQVPADEYVPEVAAQLADSKQFQEKYPAGTYTPVVDFKANAWNQMNTVQKFGFALGIVIVSYLTYAILFVR